MQESGLLEIAGLKSTHVDKAHPFCQHAAMSRPLKKLIALMLAVWFPLFSGNALAMHVAMKVGGADCQAAATQQTSHLSHQDKFSAGKLDAQQNQATPHHEGKNAGCSSCSVCHLACCGYISTATITMAEVQQPPATYPFFSTLFQSFTSAPLDPPPLARV